MNYNFIVAKYIQIHLVYIFMIIYFNYKNKYIYQNKIKCIF